MGSKGIPQPLSAAVKQQILEWLETHGPGSLSWVVQSVKIYWPRTKLADIRDFLQLDPRITSFRDKRGTTVYGVRESLPAKLPPQKPRLPDIELPPFRMHWPLVPDGRLQVSWGELLRRLPSNVENLETDYVDLIAEDHSPWSVSTLLTDRGKQWICWRAVPGLEASAYTTWRWHAWRLEDLGRYGFERARLTHPETEKIVVVTWASSTSLGLMREVVSDLIARFDRAGRISIQTVRVSDSELLDRRLELAYQEEISRQLKRSGTRIQSRIIRGYCLICGMGLSDSESLERGIGPECWRKVNHIDVNALRRHASGGSAAVGSRTVTDWARRVKASISVR